MKKSGLYRVGSALLAAVLVFTCMPQTGSRVSAEESSEAGEYVETLSGEPKEILEEINEEEIMPIADDESEYQITYVLDGGTNPTDNSNPSTYKASTLPITLQDPEKQGYTFGGWYTDENFGAENKKESIESGSTGDITLYAKWEAKYEINPPAQTVYLTDETKIVVTGGEIINKADGSKTDITEGMIAGFDLSKEGVWPVSVTYDGASLTFDVLVVEKPTGLTMRYGQALSAVKVQPPENGSGHWEWENPSASPDKVEPTTYNLKFVPGDSKFTERGGISVDVNVTPRKVKVSGISVDNKTYDGIAFAVAGTPVLRDASSNAVITDPNVSLQASYKGTGGTSYDSNTAPKNAGNYELSFSLTGANQNLYELTGTTSYAFEIAKRTLKIVAVANPSTIKVGVSASDPTYTQTGLISGDTLTKEPEYSYGAWFTNPPPKGTYQIVRTADADAGPNYEIQYTEGTLTVEEDPANDDREKLTVEFDNIKVKAKTYDGREHSIIGYPLWSIKDKEIPLSCFCEITGTTRKGVKYDKAKQVEFTHNGIATEFKEVYEEIAPAECGSYTFKITVTADKTKYDYQGSGFKESFLILPLQKDETKLLGVSGITGKFYDGKPVDYSSQIKAAKVQTNSGVDLKDAPLDFGIRGKTADSETEDYEVTIDPDAPAADMPMPSKAGSYTLWVKLHGTENYLENEWEFPFEIKRPMLTVTVEDKKIPVHADGSLLGDYSYVITDEKGEVLSNDKFAKLDVAPIGEVDTTKPGEYELAVSGNFAETDYDVTYVNGKLFIQAQLCGVKELQPTRYTNIPNGTSLAGIAGSYLPRTTTIYLDQEMKIKDTAVIQWDTERPYTGSYSVNDTAEQTFKMKGTLVLPDQVYAEKSQEKLLTVVVDVSVREAYEGQAMMPIADVPTGTVGEGSRVSLSTEEPGGRIYYTVEADNPSMSTNSKLYTGPIEIKCTMTIRAVTRVKGKRDSEELRLVYYFDRNYKPGGDDPDDPDNPSVPDEDVPKDENGNKLPIPEGLWVTDVVKCTYTGKAIKPEVRVYDHKRRLEEKKDYTISYKNNVNAADKNSAKAPTITVKGKGNYEGTLPKTFTIEPKNINDPDVKADDLTVAFNNKAQKPVPVVTWNGKKLAAKKDYSFDAAPQSAVGSYTVKLTGAGNYTGEREIHFTISNAKLAAKLSVSKLPACTYTGEAFTPEPVVKDGKEILKDKVDYTLTYEDNIEVGTASVIITGAGRFAGVKRVNFQIKEAALLNKAKAELRFASPTIYTGKEITASDCIVTVQVKTNGGNQVRTLVKDTDYRVTYQNNVKPGKATAVFEGIGAYRGTLKKTFTISAYELPLDRNKLLKIQTEEAYPYMKGGSTPKPVITFDGKTLKEGTDYTVSYKNNKAAGSPATMTIKGKGNFAGSVARGFNVQVQDIAKTSVEPADKVFQAKANIYKTTIRVYDTNGKALSAGKDYNKEVLYTYANDTTLVNGTVKKANEAVAAADVIPAGTKIRVTVNAVGSNYQGTAAGEYTIVRSDIAKAKVTVPDQTYSGKPIALQEKDITVTVNGTVVSPEEYKIVSCSNNVNKGTAKLTIRGQGNFGGTKTVSFKIKGKSLLGQIFG